MPEKKSPIKKTATRKPTARKPRAHKEPVAHKPAVAEVKHEAPAVEAKTALVKIPHGKNFYAVGRRKTAVTQVLVSEGNGTITVNKLPFEKYFMTASLQQIVLHPLTTVGQDKHLNVKAKVKGGGIHSQAESMRHALARALTEMDPESRRTLKKLGFLTRDPRVKERKKPGLKRARRAPQFSKR